MKDLYVRDLQPNQIVVGDFLVQSKELRAKKTGADSYLSVTLADKSGEVDAKMWDNVEEFDALFERDDFVKVKGAVQIYRNKPQLTLHKLKRLSDDEVDFADFFPHSKRDPEEMWAELQSVVASMSNGHLQALLTKIVSSPDTEKRLKRAPAAKSLHHAYLGGLLEHVLSLCRLAKLVAQNYPAINLDLLLTGIVFHDLGKIYELSYNRSFNYSTEGQLLGHMVLETEMLHRALAEMPAFPRTLQVLIEHLIISHHGHYEFGSPKLPMFPEALMLHYLDDLDSKMQGMLSIIERDNSVAGDWTGYLPSLGRPLLKLEKYLAEPDGTKTDEAALAGGSNNGASNGNSADSAAPAERRTKASN